MKVLLDPIYTGRLSVCASAFKMRQVVDHLMKCNDDVFFYWIVPDNLTPEERNWLPKSARIQYFELIPRVSGEDRTKRYFQIYDWYEKLLSFDAGLYDTDLLVTNKPHLVPLIKNIQTKPSRAYLVPSRKILVIEDMPMMTFKMNLHLPAKKAIDVSTLTGYLCADLVAMGASLSCDH